MDFCSAVDLTIEELDNPGGYDDYAVQVALDLALHAWQHSGDTPDWHLFGTAVQAVHAQLYPRQDPVAILVDTQIPDQTRLRPATVRLVNAAARHLNAAASNPAESGTRRWEWGTAATQLQAATVHLQDPP
jgi:hypothetical protein